MFGMSRQTGSAARVAEHAGRRLRGFLLAGVLLLFAAAPGVAVAADLVIGFIDSERIFAEYQRARDADAELRADVAKWNEEADSRQRELEKLIEDYDSQSLILSEPRRREFEEEMVADWLPEPELIGLLNDDTTPVGQVHLGVVFAADSGGRPIEVRETEKLSGGFVLPEEVSAGYDHLETWSQLLFDHLTAG